MRPLRGWTGGQAAGAARPEGEAAAPFGSDTAGAQRDQAFADGLARYARFSPDAQHSQDEATRASFVQQVGLGGRSDAGLFREGYQTAADQALAALAAVKALPIGQRFAANSPKNTATDAGGALPRDQAWMRSASQHPEQFVGRSAPATLLPTGISPQRNSSVLPFDKDQVPLIMRPLTGPGEIAAILASQQNQASSPTFQKLDAQFPDSTVPGYHIYRYAEALGPVASGNPSTSNLASSWETSLKNAVPGGEHTGMPIQDQQISTASFAGQGGPVITYVDPENHAIFNYTLQGHLLFEGFVERQIVQVGDKLYMVTTGIGVNKTQNKASENKSLAWLNKEIAPLAFENSTNAIRSTLGTLPPSIYVSP